MGPPTKNALFLLAMRLCSLNGVSLSLIGIEGTQVRKTRLSIKTFLTSGSSVALSTYLSFKGLQMLFVISVYSFLEVLPSHLPPPLKALA